MNPRLYFDEKTLKKLGDVFVVNTYFLLKQFPTVPTIFCLYILLILTPYTTLIIQAEN